MQLDACYIAFDPEPVKEGSKTFKQRVSIRFFDHHTCDFEVVSSRKDDFFQSTRSLRRIPMDVSAFDRKISFRPVGKAFDAVDPLEFTLLQGQPIHVVLSCAPMETYVPKDKSEPTQYYHPCSVLDPTDLSDTGITVRFNLDSDIVAVDPGLYFGVINFKTSHDKKFNQPIPIAVLYNNELGDLISDPKLLMSA
ncbi:hypothetical protein B1757_12405 [Acidithiobacillus marinus]|uniref:Uncharacterized protein n=1 Tax=Acidithiobacillus marinus TaxID=187490 RepID=A0A2I1DJN2_9PROT|nr:hypothetical protein [Acidithiobacillus marinus]PKY10074.1 hypothetical protein B1757_12405 [Acidithiobacillus marinus]